MKKMFRIMAVVMALMLVGAAFASCGGSATDSKAEGDNAETQAETKEEVKELDWSNPDFKLAYGDFEGMQTFMSEASEGKYDGKVVQIEGYSDKLGSNYSVMERDAEDSSSVGVNYKITDAADDDYPANDSKVTLTGTMVVDDETFGVRHLEVLPENVVVSE